MPAKINSSRFSAFLFSPKIASLAAVGVTLVILGCMCLNFGGNYAHEDGVLAQEGSVNVAPNSQLDVYYPIPYANIPNLTIEDHLGHCLIVEQKESHFRVCNNGIISFAVEWKARGIRCNPPAVLAQPVSEVSPGTGSLLPPQPAAAIGDSLPDAKVGQPK